MARRRCQATTTKRSRATIRRSQTVERNAAAELADCYAERRAGGNNAIEFYRLRSEFTPDSLNVSERSVRATICTETPVEVWDYLTDRRIGEVLTVDGMDCDETVRLLDSHSSYRAASVLGSVDDFIEEESSIDARLRFSSAPDVEPIWTRVRERHLRGVSVGGSYGRGDFVDIEPGQSATIGGRTYTAGEIPLRVVTRWWLWEVSVVPIPADAAATIRSRQTETQPGSRNDRSSQTPAEATSDRSPARADRPKKGEPMLSRRALRFLRSLGLSRSADDTAIRRFCRGLSAENREELYRISPRSREILEASPSRAHNADPAPTGEPAPSSASSSGLPAAGNDAAAIERARQQERERITAIRRLATDDVPADLVERAIAENWSEDQAGRRFYEAIRRSAPPAIGYDRGRGPGIHSSEGPTVETLQAALALRMGLSLEANNWRSEASRVVLSRAGGEWLHNANREIERGNLSARHAAIMDRAHRYRSASLVDFCRMALQAVGRQVPSDRELLIERAFSSSALTRVFGAIVSAQIVAGYEAYEDSTRGWVSEADWPDFRQNQPVGIEPGRGLQLHARGVNAPHIEVKDYGERYAVNRFVGQFTLDDQDIIDDTVGLDQQLPDVLGSIAAQIRPDLVYATILTNPTLSDGTQLFATTALRQTGNAMTGQALSNAALSAGEQRMASFNTPSDDGSTSRPLNLMAGWLIVPRALRQTGKQATGSSRLIAGSASATQGDLNPHDGEWQLRSDARLDNGCVSPLTGTLAAGSATRYYVVEKSGKRFLQVGYRKGTGRAPTIRQQRLNQPGRWGMGWDVALDIGIGVVDWKGCVRLDQ